MERVVECIKTMLELIADVSIFYCGLEVLLFKSFILIKETLMLSDHFTPIYIIIAISV